MSTDTETGVSRDDFWDALGNATAGMLSAGSAKPAPMTHYIDSDRGLLWFVTARDTDLARELARGSQAATHVVGEGGARIYARIEGEAELVMDREKLDEIWNPVADAWFEEGKSDPDLVMIRMRLTEAEVWLTPGTARFFYEIAKAQVSGDRPDGGSHGVVRF